MNSANLIINTTNICQNWQMLNKTSQKTCAAVVKANAYGLGLGIISKELHKVGCQHFFTAYLEEALQVRQQTKNAKIYTLNGYDKSEHLTYVKYKITPIIHSVDSLKTLLQQEEFLPFIIQFDTGMNRLGFKESQIEKVLDLCNHHKVLPEYVMSHLCSSEEKTASENVRQLNAFKRITQHFPHSGHSLSNSSGIFLGPDYHFNLTRPGYALYGGNPTPYADKNPMRNCISLYAPILQIRHILKGEAVGYNNTWVAKRNSVIATLSYGYADGLHRSAASHNLKAYIENYEAPFVGHISMDLSCIDITNTPLNSLKNPTSAEIIGTNQSIEKIAESYNSTGYEVLTSLGQRLTRTYLK